jgi:hypothetical protein
MIRAIQIQRSESDGEGAHRGNIDGEVLAVLEFDGEAVPAIFELRESDDGVQEETTRAMACRDWSLASCRREERWLEIRGAAVLCRARRRTVCMKRSGAGVLTRRCRSTRRAWWRDLRARGALELRQFLAEVSSGGSKIWPWTNTTLWSTSKIEPMSEGSARSRERCSCRSEGTRRTRLTGNIVEQRR